MNYETYLINAILESGDLNTALEQGVDSVFSESRDVWNFMIEFNQQYDKVPSKDVIKNNFKTFEFVKTESPLQYYIDDAKKKGLGKSVRSSLAKAIDLLKNDDDPAKVLSFIQSQATDLIRTSGRLQETNIVDWKERAEILEERINNPFKQILGIPSGIGVIDKIFGGFQAGDFVILMAWTGVGKSSLTRLFAVNAWKAGYSPLVISLEMDKLQEEYRIDTILNAGDHFTNTQLVNGSGVDINNYKGWAKGTFEGKHPFHLITTEGIDVCDQNFIEAKIKQLKPDMVIIDSHSLCEDARGGGNETERAKNLSKDFKRMALRNSVPIIDITHVTMDKGHEERAPELNEVAWSKQLVQDADMVLALHRERDSERFQVVTRKTRRCPDFAFYLDWNLDTGKWKEVFDIGDF